MLRIAICDDTPLYAGELAAQLYEIAEEMSVEVAVVTNENFFVNYFWVYFNISFFQLAKEYQIIVKKFLL